MQAYEEKILELGIEEYAKAGITITELAQKSNRSLWEIMEILKERKIQSAITLKEIEQSERLF